MKKLRFWWKTLVIVDVSNIYTTYAKYKKIFKFESYLNFLKQLINFLVLNYKKINKENIYLFLGVDYNLKKSVLFCKELERFLWKDNIIKKKVKYFSIDGNLKRKADLDADIWFYIWKLKNKFTSFLILSSDWDFANIYKELLEEWKQVIVLHWYITEKEKKNNTKKKLKHYNVWKEILKLQEEFKWHIWVSPIDILLE